MKSSSVIALHGFLGRPSDWDFLTLDHCTLQAIDLYDIASPEDGFKEWAQRLNRFAQTVEPPRVLTGYSLGGRLALHALMEQTEVWSGAVMISTFPGAMSDAERQRRREADKHWSERFATENWESLIDDWNRQSTLSISLPIRRREEDYSRHQLAASLNCWSPAQQQDFSSALEAMDIPILWAVGNRDKKYVEIAGNISLRHPKSKIWIAPDAGHRLLSDAPDKLQTEMQDFINQI